MSRRFLIFIIPLIIVAVAGCQSNEGRIQASLDKEFSLSIGQAAEIKGEQLSLQFEGIQEDSRCPEGATCFWAGRVISTLLINDNGLTSRIMLTEPRPTDQPDANTYKQYRFSSQVQPYPKLGKQTAKEEYRLILTIEKDAH